MRIFIKIDFKKAGLKKRFVIPFTVLCFVLAISIGLNVHQHKREMLYRRLPTEHGDEVGLWLNHQRESYDTEDIIADYSWTVYNRPRGIRVTDEEYLTDKQMGEAIDFESVTFLMRKGTKIIQMCNLASTLSKTFEEHSFFRIHPEYFTLLSKQTAGDGREIWFEYIVYVFDRYDARRAIMEAKKLQKMLENPTSNHLVAVAGAPKK